MDGRKSTGHVFYCCARLIGPEVKITLEQSLPGNLSPAEWLLVIEIVDAVKIAIPDAGKKPRRAVLEYVLNALSATHQKHAIMKSIVS